MSKALMESTLEYTTLDWLRAKEAGQTRKMRQIKQIKQIRLIELLGRQYGQ